MQSPQMVVPIPERIPDGDEIGHTSYGLGLGVSTYRGRKHVGHGGGIDGFISAMDWFPEERIGVVVLTNFSGNNPVPTLVARRIFDGLIELEPVDWAARARKRAEEARKEREETREKLAEERQKDTSPTHALEDYASDYEHPAYGLATVTVDGDGLECDVVGFTVPLEHYHYDIFAVPQDLSPPLETFGGRLITFSYNKKGEIDGVAIPLEPSVDDIVFTRRTPDEEEHAGSSSR